MQLFLETYGNTMLFMVLNAMLALSLYLPLMAGQLSLASPGFLALGGYVAAWMSTNIFIVPEGPYPLGYIFIEMIIAAVASGILAIIVGIPALRLRGIYLALATIAFIEIVRVLSLTLPITGGAVGIFGIPQPFGNALGYIRFSLPLLLAVMLGIYRLERIRVGRAFDAIRTDELAADAMGINTTYHKVLAFTLGAILAGVVGVIYAHALNTWNARQGTFDVGVVYLTFVLVGGSRTVLGPVLGAFVLTALPEVLRLLGNNDSLPLWISEFLKSGRAIVYGSLIILATIFFPQGLITPKLWQRRRKNGKTAA